ncbi:hypothetical protein DPMN_026991 [Dreissena polymorpha]|uniref:Uncharacterized protein n=1 Tax=Dreissena polymorpha TaxID=45954 RepID=A0A9D4RE04_DREPO|nr:hypothetical protein DPMN_026991 [Dreissena polymorpha]
MTIKQGLRTYLQDVRFHKGAAVVLRKSKFHANWAKNVTSTANIVTSRVFTRENCHYIHIEKNAPPTGGHVFSPISTILKLWAKSVTSGVLTRKTAPPTGGHVFQRIGTTFELNQDIIKTNIQIGHEIYELGRDFIGTKLLTKFHEDGTRNVASRVFTSKCLRTDGRTYDGQRPVTKAQLSNQIQHLTKFGESDENYLN